MLFSFIASIIICFLAIYVWIELYCYKLNFKKISTQVYIILFIVLSLTNYNYNLLAFKMIISILLLGVFNWLIFRRSLRETIIGTIVCEGLFIVSETIFILIINIFIDINNMEMIMGNYFGFSMTNIIIAVISAFIMQFEIVKKFYNWLIKLTSRIGLKQITLITLIVIMSYSLVFFNTYNESDFATILMTNTVLIILYTFITFKMIKAQDSYLSVKSKYVTALGSLKEYEKMLDQYRIMNHENKNQLLTVRSMIVKKEEKITNYIDNIINEKINDDEKLMFETSIIPEGGLRAVVYSKILHMKNNQINFYLNIDRKVRSYDLVDLDDNLVLDICKIISVYLDNAIDEVKDIKDGSVSIKFYVEDNKLCISISNTFDFVELDFIDNRGYTTKSEGHGYGLPLAKKIIDNSKNLYNYREINDNIFTQILKIKV